jgi:hypothetical protein
VTASEDPDLAERTAQLDRRVTLSRRDRETTWHNGGTGGFRSVVGLDRAAGRGVALVRASTRGVQKAGFALLAEPGDAHS